MSVGLWESSPCECVYVCVWYGFVEHQLPRFFFGGGAAGPRLQSPSLPPQVKLYEPCKVELFWQLPLFTGVALGFFCL